MQINCVVKAGLLLYQLPRSMIWHQIAAINSLVLVICMIDKHKFLASV